MLQTCTNNFIETLSLPLPYFVYISIIVGSIFCFDLRICTIYALCPILNYVYTLKAGDEAL